MSSKPDRHKGWSRKCRFAALAVAAAVSGQAWAGEGGAQPESGGFWNTVLEKLDLRTKVGPMPDFVQKTRPDSSALHFIPTTAPHPKGSVAVKSADDVETAKQALDAARDAQLNPPAPAPKPAHATKRAAKPNRAPVQN